jgi:hypothetical protein
MKPTVELLCQGSRTIAIVFSRNGSQRCKIAIYLMLWLEQRMGKKLGISAADMRVRAVNRRQDRNCEDTEVEIVNTSGEQNKTSEAE